ncbi:MAG: nucleotidyltransferase domain-containing protein [Candidatus Caldarchaeum sp.]
MQRLVEGCYLVDFHGDVYAVKGLVHPPSRVYAVPRVVKGVKVKDFSQALDYVLRERPDYLFDDPYTGRVVIAIPENMILRRLYPVKTPQGPSKLVSAAEELAQHLSEARVEFGFTGSLLTGYTTEKSDIDIVVYGEGRKAYEVFSKLRREGFTKPVTAENLTILLESRRDTAKAVEMAAAEQRKVLTGVFRNVLYTVKIVPENFWETWEDTRCKPIQNYEAVVEVVDDSTAFYTPGRYGVRVVEGDEIGRECREIIYFRSRFAEMAEKGCRVRVRGLLEKVLTKTGSYLRLNVGVGRDDYILGDLPE